LHGPAACHIWKWLVQRSTSGDGETVFEARGESQCKPYYAMQDIPDAIEYWDAFVVWGEQLCMVLWKWLV